MTLNEIKSILDSRDLQLTKSLGQNFLHDARQLERIAASAKLSPADSVLEIGPGLGPLTELLVRQAGKVLAIEKDRRLFEFLEKKFAGQPNLTLICADVLEYLKDRPGEDWTGWKLVANLPYSVASPIMVELALASRPPETLAATLQLEVVERLSARPDTDEYGLLTLLVQLNFAPQGWFKIPPACFFPPPNVDSACVTLARRPSRLLSLEEQRVFVRLVKRGFSQRRKMMFKLLKAEWPAPTLEAAFADASLDSKIRAEKVSLEQFVKMARLLHSHSSKT